MEGLLAKKASEMVFGVANQTSSEEQEGGKKKKKTKGKGGDNKNKVKSEPENFDVLSEIKRAIFEGGNKKEQTFLENEFNYPFIMFGLLISFKIYNNNN